MKNSKFFEFWKQDLVASFVVFLVALPLCMGIAIASGVPPAMGLITGIVGGIIVGFLAGCPLQVSGPAAGLAVIVWEIVHKQGIEVLGPIILLAGIIQLAAGFVKGGQWFRMVAPSVIYGMLAGIGILILGSQFHIMIDDKPEENGLMNLLSIPEALYKGIFPVDGSVHHMAAAIGLLTIVTVVLWNRFRPQQLKFVPGALVGITLALIASQLFQLPIQYVSVPDNLLSNIQWPGFSAFARLAEPSIFMTAFALAIVASAETLLCATAVDQMQQGERTDYDRELKAQGLGNLICGLLGALPMTGVIVRSSANIDAGGQTRLSAIMHGVWLLAFILIFPFVLSMIPTASLAAILVYIGYKLVSIENIKKLIPYGKSELAIYFATVGGVVALDLLKGVILGVVLSLLKLLYTLTHLEVKQIRDPQNQEIHVHLAGAATFMSLPQLSQALDQVASDAAVHIHFEKLDYIDHACLELVFNWESYRESLGQEVSIEHNLQQKSQSPKKKARRQVRLEKVSSPG